MFSWLRVKIFYDAGFAYFSAGYADYHCGIRDFSQSTLPKLFYIYIFLNFDSHPVESFSEIAEAPHSRFQGLKRQGGVSVWLTSQQI